MTARVRREFRDKPVGPAMCLPVDTSQLAKPTRMMDGGWIAVITRIQSAFSWTCTQGRVNPHLCGLPYLDLKVDGSVG